MSSHRALTRPTGAAGIEWALIGGLLLVLVCAPFFLEPSWLRVGQLVMIGAVGAIGLTLLTGQAGQLSLATPFYMLVGGATYTVLGADDTPSRVGFGLPSVVALVGAVLVSAVLGLAFAPVAGRVRGVYLGVATLSLVYVGLYLGQQWTSISGGTASGRPVPDLNLLGIKFLRASNREERVWWL
ncbi:MAG: branched-chain amino acid ABC transporter permease, partial [Sporichthyaceae bacterium]